MIKARVIRQGYVTPQDRTRFALTCLVDLLGIIFKVASCVSLINWAFTSFSFYLYLLTNVWLIIIGQCLYNWSQVPAHSFHNREKINLARINELEEALSARNKRASILDGDLSMTYIELDIEKCVKIQTKELSNTWKL